MTDKQILEEVDKAMELGKRMGRNEEKNEILQIISEGKPDNRDATIKRILEHLSEV